MVILKLVYFECMVENIVVFDFELIVVEMLVMVEFD